MPTLFDKLWDRHAIAETPGGATIVAIDRIFLHERTGAAALNSLAAAGRRVADPARVFAAMDHIVDTVPGRSDATTMPGGTAFITETRAACRAAGITLFDIGDADQGIVHVVSPELGIVLPGLTLVAPDSHSCTQGAVGALAWGIGSTEAEHALATGTLRVRKPPTMRVTFTGAAPEGVTPKDMALALIAAHGAAGGQGHAIEFAGPAVTALAMEGRMTLCNMATEFAAFTGMIAPDATTFAWLAGRRYAPKGALWDAALADWQDLSSDGGAVFDREIAIDAATLAPMVSWGTSPAQSIAITGRVPADAPAKALAYMGLAAGQPLAGLPIDAAFIGSCTNSRLSDLERSAAIVAGRHVAPGVLAIVVPGSSAVKRAAEARGLDRIFTAAGFEWRESGCSMCFFAGGESFAPGARVISSTNRNFENRQGLATRTHIASPETVARSARRLHRMSKPFVTLAAVAAPMIEDNIDTDIIIPSREMKTTGKTGLAAGLFAGRRYRPGTRTENPEFILNQPQYRSAAILLAGDNFGCGSSREHAVWALAEHGIRAVIAPSFSPIFAGNAVRGGVLPLALPRAAIAELAACTGPIAINLPAQTVTAGDRTIAFAIDAEAKAMLVGGLDAIDITMQSSTRIADWQARNRKARPWVYLGDG